MSLYNALGKGLVAMFIGLATLLSHASSPLPEVIPAPSAEEIMPISESQINISSENPDTSGNFPIASTSEQISTTPAPVAPASSKPIPIYLNYPEKDAITPAKTVDTNFQKVFQYSLEAPITAASNNSVSSGNQSSAQSNTLNPSTSNTVSGSTPSRQQNTSPINLPTPSSISAEDKIKNSVVNIFCSIQNGRNIKVVTGSGVIIDPRGIILTDAHVGEYPLLQNSSIASNMTCSIRTGSPVNKTYGVRVLYISKDWITTNYQNMAEAGFSETGEGDVAILEIVDKTTGLQTGNTFDYFSLASSAPSINDQISIASYPADILGTSGINSLLTVQIEQLRVGDTFSFSGNSNADLVETSDSLEAQHGSSGGALLNNSNSLAGLIAITVSGNSPLMKHVRALTIPHISNTVQKDTGLSLESFISQNTNAISSQFASSRQNLVQLLINGSAAQFFQ